MFLRRKLHALLSVLILGLALLLPAMPAQAAPMVSGELPVISWWSDFVSWMSGLVYEPPAVDDDSSEMPPAHQQSSGNEPEGDDDRGSGLDPIG